MTHFCRTALPLSSHGFLVSYETSQQEESGCYLRELACTPCWIKSGGLSIKQIQYVKNKKTRLTGTDFTWYWCSARRFLSLSLYFFSQYEKHIVYKSWILRYTYLCCCWIRKQVQLVLWNCIFKAESESVWDTILWAYQDWGKHTASEQPELLFTFIDRICYIQYWLVGFND